MIFWTKDACWMSAARKSALLTDADPRGESSPKFLWWWWQTSYWSQQISCIKNRPSPFTTVRCISIMSHIWRLSLTNLQFLRQFDVFFYRHVFECQYIHFSIRYAIYGGGTVGLNWIICDILQNLRLTTIVNHCLVAIQEGSANRGRGSSLKRVTGSLIGNEFACHMYAASRESGSARKR
jgi:hypothetical protein